MKLTKVQVEAIANKIYEAKYAEYDSAIKDVEKKIRENADNIRTIANLAEAFRSTAKKFEEVDMEIRLGWYRDNDSFEGELMDKFVSKQLRVVEKDLGLTAPIRQSIIADIHIASVDSQDLTDIFAKFGMTP